VFQRYGAGDRRNETLPWQSPRRTKGSRITMFKGFPQRIGKHCRGALSNWTVWIFITYNDITPPTSSESSRFQKGGEYGSFQRGVVGSEKPTCKSKHWYSLRLGSRRFRVRKAEEMLHILEPLHRVTRPSNQTVKPKHQTFGLG
jgi:hypothetical protein